MQTHNAARCQRQQSLGSHVLQRCISGGESRLVMSFLSTWQSLHSCWRNLPLIWLYFKRAGCTGNPMTQHLAAVSILGFENCQSFFPYNCPCTYGVPQCAAHTSLIGTTLAKLSKQLRNITYRQLFNKHTILSCLFLKMVVYCNKQLCK